MAGRFLRCPVVLTLFSSSPVRDWNLCGDVTQRSLEHAPMNSINSFTPAEIISLHQGQPVTTSLKVAKVFGKQHKDVLRKITTLDCSKNFNERNFALVTYQDGKGEARPAYEMTKGRLYLCGDGLHRRQGRGDQRGLYQRLQLDGRATKPASVSGHPNICPQWQRRHLLRPPAGQCRIQLDHR